MLGRRVAITYGHRAKTFPLRAVTSFFPSALQ